jgi:hypothetical protein
MALLSVDHIRNPGPRWPSGRFAFDERYQALALARVVQQAEYGLELRPAPRHR